MGSPAEENGHEADEKLHAVTLTQGFWLGQCEVTVDQWAVFAKDTGYQTEAERGDGLTKIIRGQWLRDPASNWKNPGFPQTGDHPVVGISWHDAMTFCRWLTEREHQVGRLPAHYRYTLPTEAEWEHACRAGSADPCIGDPKKLLPACGCVTATASAAS